MDRSSWVRISIERRLVDRNGESRSVTPLILGVKCLVDLEFEGDDTKDHPFLLEIKEVSSIVHCGTLLETDGGHDRVIKNGRRNYMG